MEPDSPINSDWLKNKSAEKMKAHPEAKSSDWVHIEEVPEMQPETEVETPQASCTHIQMKWTQVTNF